MANGGRWLAGIAGSLAGFVYLFWELAHRATYLYATNLYPLNDADEWRYTACSRLVEHGYTLFTQVFSAQPPLLFLSLAGGMTLSGDSILGARSAEIAYGVVGLAAAMWLAWQIAGPAAGAATALLLAISPGYLVYAHTVEAEGPMMALTTLSLALAYRGRRSRRPVWATLSGLVLAAAVLTKLFALEAVAPGLWALLAGSGIERERVRNAALFLAGLCLPVSLDFALLAPRAQWDQVVALHQAAAGLHLANVTPPLDILRDFLTLDAGLSLLALAGLVSLVLLRRSLEAVFLLLWVAGTVLMLLWFKPLFPHHAAILEAGLGVSAGVFISCAAAAVTRRRLALLPAGLLAVAYLALLPRLVHADRHLLIPWTNPAVTGLTAFTDRETSPGDMVAADDLAVADLAHRLVPPPLCDPSNVRLQSGYLSASDLIGATQRYHPKLVLPSFGIYIQVHGYTAWLRGNYRRIPAPGGITAYLARQSQPFR